MPYHSGMTLLRVSTSLKKWLQMEIAWKGWDSGRWHCNGRFFPAPPNRSWLTLAQCWFFSHHHLPLSICFTGNCSARYLLNVSVFLLFSLTFVLNLHILLDNFTNSTTVICMLMISKLSPTSCPFLKYS